MTIKRKLHYFEFLVVIKGAAGGDDLQEKTCTLFARSEHGARRKIFQIYGNKVFYIEKTIHEIRDITVDLDELYEFVNQKLIQKENPNDNHQINTGS